MVETEITIGMDGRVRDVMIKKPGGGDRVEAAILGSPKSNCTRSVGQKAPPKTGKGEQS